MLTNEYSLLSNIRKVSSPYIEPETFLMKVSSPYIEPEWKILAEEPPPYP